MVHLQKEIARLKTRILSLGGLVEENLWRSVRALEEGDLGLAREAIAHDAKIDTLEVEIEEECLKALALHQPVAVDLRFIVAVLKINNDLERIGDLSVNIARRAKTLAKRPEVDEPYDLGGMAAEVRDMLRRSLDALVNLDVEMAEAVCLADDSVDKRHKRTWKRVAERIERHPGDYPALSQIQSASNHLERIADLATNIAEDVIYMVEGRIVRHRANRQN
jgi:phosphate transport system protein